uniref:DUF4283 domain-containing protein n=1 Tax=Opuntia streptacantha TaxID=393608 RepID=A0A7C8YQJ1_OPUST
MAFRSLLLWESLDLGDLTTRFWWYGLVLVVYSDFFCARAYCESRSGCLWWVPFVRVIVALYCSVQAALFIILLWLLLLVSDPSIMSAPSSSIPKTLSPQTDLHSPNVGSPSPPPLPSKPSSSSSVSYSEVLILGGGGQCSDPANINPTLNPQDNKVAQSPMSPPSDSHNQTHSASMHTLCLLGRPWGEAIPLPIVISKTRKDWGFVKGQLDYLDLGNGWIRFRFSNLQDITLVWKGRPWHVSGLNLVLRRWEPSLTHSLPQFSG